MRTDRSRVTVLEDLPNVGPAIAADFRRLGIRTPAALKGRDPYALYAALNRVTGQRHDPCVLDTFIAVVRFVDGALWRSERAFVPPSRGVDSRTRAEPQPQWRPDRSFSRYNLCRRDS